MVIDSDLINYVNFKCNDDKQYFDFLYRRSRISNIELIDIILSNKTEIIKVEEEKADNKYRKSYLSNVAHEFKAPIQVLMLTVGELTKFPFPEKAIGLFKDIENLGNYILILIMDIISFSKNDTGIEVKFKSFFTSSPFKFAFQILQLLIRNNNNKCFSITPILNLDKSLPDTINTDESRLNNY